MNIISKLKDLGKNTDYTYLILLGLGVSSIVIQSYSLCVALVCFSGLHGFRLWQDRNKVIEHNKDIEKELEQVKDFVSTLSMQKAARPTGPTETRRFFG